ncbi:hypothetical protein ACL00O_00100 [Aeromonas sanarellii]|uniref:hypothetical protein n=1 Tax=Aeromonas sanarellii TaxID=633415 RepID=UPI0039A21D7A
MELQLLKTFLLWNLSISNLVIIVWFAAFAFVHDGMWQLVKFEQIGERPVAFRFPALPIRLKFIQTQYKVL